MTKIARNNNKQNTYSFIFIDLKNLKKNDQYLEKKNIKIIKFFLSVHNKRTLNYSIST